jgi:hypothetical protein
VDLQTCSDQRTSSFCFESREFDFLKKKMEQQAGPERTALWQEL